MNTQPMTPEEIERLQACSREIAEILYRNTPNNEVATLDGIEQTVRRQMLEHVSPNIALFLSPALPASQKGELEH